MCSPASVLAWEIPQTERACGLQSMGLQRVRYDSVTKPPPLHIIKTLLISLHWWEHIIKIFIGAYETLQSSSAPVRLTSYQMSHKPSFTFCLFFPHLEFFFLSLYIKSALLPKLFESLIFPWKLLWSLQCGSLLLFSTCSRKIAQNLDNYERHILWIWKTHTLDMKDTYLALPVVRCVPLAIEFNLNFISHYKN